MKKISHYLLSFVLFIFHYSIFAQSTGTIDGNGGEYSVEKNDASNPCITAAQYELIESRCADNCRLLGINPPAENQMLTTFLSWPLQAAAGFNDCSFYGISAYVDQNTNASAITDYNCGTNTYDGHGGTDIFTFPFHFYKMDNDQVEVIAAAAGTIIDKDDGNFDKNCGTNSLPANYVVIQHTDGSRALYWHMKMNSVTSKTVGQTVATGEYLGVVGSSGNSSGPHLHFEVWSGSTNATRIDPYSGICNTLNANSWWTAQKTYTEPAIIKASIHTTDIVTPACPATETPNESSTYIIPFQGPGLPAGYAKFYIFMRNETSGMTGDIRILNPGGSTFNSWTYTSSNTYNASWWGWSKVLPTVPGTYTFQATYNGTTCSQTFDIGNAASISTIPEINHIQIFPNPVADFIQLQGDGVDNDFYHCTLKNSIGQIVFTDEAKVENNFFQKDYAINGLPSGIYFLVVETGKSYQVIKVNKL